MAADIFSDGEVRASDLPSFKRDPHLYPFGILLVGPTIFDPIDGFHWFATEADAVDYLRSGVWHIIGMGPDSKRECRQIFVDALADRAQLDEGVLNSFAQQDDLIVVWAGRFEAICDGSDDFALGMLRDQAQSIGNPELLETSAGLVQLMSGFRLDPPTGVSGT